MKDYRLGAQLHYHLMPGEGVDPWLGAGIGYEWLRTHAESGGEHLNVTIHGFEFLNLQAGVDFAPASQVGIGPFIAFSLSQYGRTQGESSDSTISFEDGDIEDKALHQWLFLGVRGTFVL